MIKKIVKNIVKSARKVVAKEDPKCVQCQGTGRHLPEQTCPSCNGTGK